MASRYRQQDEQNGAHAPSVDARRIVDDRLPDSFAVERSESEWLITLLGADELSYIFGDERSGEGKN